MLLASAQVENRCSDAVWRRSWWWCTANVSESLESNFAYALQQTSAPYFAFVKGLQFYYLN